MKFLFFIFSVSLSFCSTGQLSFSNIGSEPAYCRVFGYQSGGGLVYASATGGNSPYTYLWTNLSTGATSSNTTWGGLNPGDYQIQVSDSNGGSISQVVTVDSLNPIAVINVDSGPTGGSSPSFTGPTGTYVFSNLSQNFANPNNPQADTTFFWNFDYPNNPWEVSNDIFSTQQYNYSSLGTYDICLVVTNKNGCADTASVTIDINTLSFDEKNNNYLTVISNPGMNQLLIKSNQPLDEKEVAFYDTSGRLVKKVVLSSMSNTIHFNYRGIFLYEIIDLQSNKIFHTGKFSF